MKAPLFGVGSIFKREIAAFTYRQIYMALEKRDFTGFTGNMAFCALFLFIEVFQIVFEILLVNSIDRAKFFKIYSLD